MKRTTRFMVSRGVLLTRQSGVAAVLGLLALLLLAPARSNADIVFSNFDTGFGYNTAEGNPVGNAFDGNFYAQADTFTASSSANFSELKIALSCLDAGLCPSDFTVSLVADAGNQPGAVIESFAVLAGSLGLLGQSKAPLILDSALQPMLSAGAQYWIMVSSAVSDSIAWNLNSTGDAAAEGLSFDGGSTWFSPSGFTPGAFEVDSAVGPTSVPEPATLPLVGFTIAIVGILVRGSEKRAIPRRLG